MLAGGQPDRRHVGGHVAAEQPALPADPRRRRRIGVREDRLGGGEDRRAIVAQFLERAARREAFELAAVEQPRIDAIGEILEVLERAAGGALGAHLVHRALADALERAQRIAHRQPAVGLASTVNSPALWLIEGGRQATPSRRMSSAKIASLSVCAMSKHIEAAKNSGL